LFFREAEREKNRYQGRLLLAVNLGLTGGKEAKQALEALEKDWT